MVKTLLFIFAGLNVSILVAWLRQQWRGSAQVNHSQALLTAADAPVTAPHQSDFQTLVENAPDAIMRLDRDFRYLYVNRKLEQESGLCRTQMLGKTNAELGFSGALVELWHHVIQQVIDTAEEQQIEFEAPSTQGLAQYSSRVVPEYSATGSIESVMAIIRNITHERQAEKLVQQQFQQSEILWEIARSIRRSLQHEDILNTAVTEIRTFLKADRVIIYQFDSTCSGTVVVESVESGFVSMLHQTVLDPCLDIMGLIKRYTQGYSFVVEDIYTSNLTPCHQNLLSQYEIRANLVVPILLQNDRLWGLLAAQQCRDSRQWQRSEVEVLHQLSTQIGIAIQQGELYQQLQSLNTDLEQQVQARTQELQKALEFESSLKRITDQVRDSLDEHEILRVAVEELATALNVKCCDAAIYNAEQTISTIVHEYNQSLPALVGKQFAMADFCEPAIYQTLLRGECSQFCFTVIRGVRPTPERLAILACPIRDDQRGV